MSDTYTGTAYLQLQIITPCIILTMRLLWLWLILQWNLSITDLWIKDNKWTPIDGPEQSAIETCTYLTSKLRTPSIPYWSSPKRSYCIVNELCNTVKATPLSLIATTNAGVPHGLSWRWLIYQTKHQISTYHSLPGLHWAFFCCLSSFSDAGEPHWLWGVACTTSELRTPL